MKLVPEPLTPEAFLPFGAVIRAPTKSGRAKFPGALQNLRQDAQPTISTSRAEPVSLPLRSSVMERHQFSSQTFLPLDVSRYLVVVAPDTGEGRPDVSRVRGFIVDGTVGITYASGTWHHAMIVLDRPGCFAVLIWRNGTSEDIETVDLPDALEILGIG